MNNNEQNRHPDRDQDTGKANAPKYQTTDEALRNLHETKDSWSDDEHENRKDRTFTASQGADTGMAAGTAEIGRVDSVDEEQDPLGENTDNKKQSLKGDKNEHRSFHKHTGKGHHAGGDTDPGFGATDRG